MDDELMDEETKALVHRLVGVAGFDIGTQVVEEEEFRRLAALIAEECAKLADDTDNGWGSGNCTPAGEAIRAKFKEPR